MRARPITQDWMAIFISQNKQREIRCEMPFYNPKTWFLDCCGIFLYRYALRCGIIRLKLYLYRRLTHTCCCCIWINAGKIHCQRPGAWNYFTSFHIHLIHQHVSSRPNGGTHIVSHHQSRSELILIQNKSNYNFSPKTKRGAIQFHFISFHLDDALRRHGGFSAEVCPVSYEWELLIKDPGCHQSRL